MTSRLPSRQPISYYALLLRGALAEPYLPAKDYQLALKLHKKSHGEVPDFPVLECGGHGGEDDIIVPYAASAAAAIERHAIVGTRIVRPSELVPGGGAGGPVASSSGSASGSGGPGGAFVPAPVVISGACGGGDGIASGAIVVRPKARVGKWEKLDFVPALEGAVIGYTGDYVTPAGVLYQNYTIKCLRHPSCCKTMGRGPQNVKRFGELGILAALHVWLSLPDDPSKTHPQVNPAKVPSLEYMEEHREELSVLFDTLTGCDAP